MAAGVGEGACGQATLPDRGKATLPDREEESY